MSFLLALLGFLAVAAGLPFPQEFLSPPSQAPPTIYQHESPTENHRGFRVQQIVPEGNTVTKVVIQVPNEPSQRTQDGFQRNPIIQHYFPDNGHHHKENQQPAQVIQYQDVLQRIHYVPQGVPENMPKLFLPAQPVAQAVEQVPQGIHYSVQRAEQMSQKSQQPFEASVQQSSNVQPVNQNNFVQKGAQAAPDVYQPGVPEGVQKVQQISSTEGQAVINGQQPGGEQAKVPSGAVHQVAADPDVNQDLYPKNVQSVPQSVQSEAQPLNNIPREQSAQQGHYGIFQQRTPQNEKNVQVAPKDTYNPQRTPEVQLVTDHQHEGRPDTAVVPVQHGPNGVHIIRQGEKNVEQQQFVQQNLVQGVNEQSQNIHSTENTSPVTIAPQIVQREQLVHPVVNVVQHGAQGVQIIREGEHNKKHVEQQRPSIRPSQAGQKADNVIAVQQVSHIPNKQIDQREPNGVHIIRQEEAQQQDYHRPQQLQQQQQYSQQNIPSTQTSQNEVNAAPATQSIPEGVQHTSNDATPTAQGITQAVFYGNVQTPRPEAQTLAQGQALYAANIANAIPPNPAPTHPSEPVQAKPTIQAAKPSQTHQVSHFSFGFQDHSSVVKQENQKSEPASVSHFSFGTQAVANQDAQTIKPQKTFLSQDIHTKPQHPEPVSGNIQHLPPSLHKLAQNVIVDIPQVSQSIKEAAHGVHAIPAAVEQASHGVHQINHGVQQAFQNVQQANPVTDGVRNVYQGIRNSIHPAILSSAEAYVNSIQRDKEPVHSQQLQQVLDQIQQVRHEVRQKQESQSPQEVLSQQEGPLDQENRQIPSQEEDAPQQTQKPFQSGFHPFQNQGQRGQPARPQYSNRKPVQSAPVNEIYDNTPHRVESPAEDDAESTPIPIIRYENSVGPDGTYQWSYEAGNGIKAQESGLLRNRGDPNNESIAVQGGYSYTGPDGIFYSVEYIADENGFQPLGRHLPTQPPLPEALQKAIDDHMAILATAEPDTDEQADESIQADKLGSSQNKYNYSQRVS